ncbi:hypothetical protein HK104_007362, partial [Borealophlyctis nickersoniae]
SAPFIIDESNIAEYVNDADSLTDKGTALTYDQFPLLIRYVTHRKVNAATSIAAPTASTSNIPTPSGMTVSDARTLKAEGMMVQMLQKQLVTYDGQRNVQTFNQFFQQLNQLFAYQFMLDEEKILVATTHLRSNANNWLQNQQKQHFAKSPTIPYHRSMSWDNWYNLLCKAF